MHLQLLLPSNTWLQHRLCTRHQWRAKVRQDMPVVRQRRVPTDDGKKQSRGASARAETDFSAAAEVARTEHWKSLADEASRRLEQTAETPQLQTDENFQVLALPVRVVSATEQVSRNARRRRARRALHDTPM